MALSINAKGAITGYYCTSFTPAGACVAHGFLRRPGGTIISFDVPGSTGTLSFSINDMGAITGSYTSANGRQFGFVRDPHGKFTSFDPGFNTSATSINNEGAITGSISDPNQNNLHGFVRSSEGTIGRFDPPFCLGFEDTVPTSINDEGVITGSCIFNGGAIGWVRFP
jgi:hypothetical protein